MFISSSKERVKRHDKENKEDTFQRALGIGFICKYCRKIRVLKLARSERSKRFRLICANCAIIILNHHEKRKGLSKYR